MKVRLGAPRATGGRVAAVAAGLTAVAFLAAGPAPALAGTAPAPGSPAGAAGPATTGPVPDGFATWQALWATQERLNAGADQITEAADAAGDDNLGGIVADPQERGLRVYWKGRVPDRVRTMIARVQRTVPVRTFPAEHGARYLTAEAKRLAEAGSTASPRITSAAPRADGSGIDVVVDGPAELGRQHPAIQALTERAGPLVLTVRSAPAPRLASRWDDGIPRWGGAAFRIPRDNSHDTTCSTGFAIFIPTRLQFGLLTAGHCGSNGQFAYNGSGWPMGFVTADNDAHDVMVIDTLSGGRIYDGGVNSGEFSKPVKGASASYVGNYVCTSGAYSGARCNIKVTAVGRSLNVGYVISPLVQAEEQSGANAAGHGDSGGPVFSLGSSVNEVVAKGTLTGMVPEAPLVPCTGILDGDRKCSAAILYVDIQDALGFVKAVIVTG